MNFKILRDNERYVVADCVVGGWTYSVTVLHPQQETLGHKHSYEEAYSFLFGSGEMLLDCNVLQVARGTSLWVQSNSHHRVRNLSKHEPLVFTCIFKGNRT